MKLKNCKCLLDMDGVLVDWVNGISDYANIDNPYNDSINWGIGRYCDAFGTPMTKKRIYEIMDDVDFWVNLNPLPFYKSLINTTFEIFGAENVCICTKPTRSGKCLDGKYQWIEKHVPEFKDNFIIAMDKSFCANPRHILIDDMYLNTKKFIDSGGVSLLFPTLQNSAFPIYKEYLDGKTDISEWIIRSLSKTIRRKNIESY